MLNYSDKAITVHIEGGGGGEGTLILFDTCVGPGILFLFKFLNYIIFLFIYLFFRGGGGGVRNINSFGGLNILWIFLGVTTKLD